MNFKTLSTKISAFNAGIMAIKASAEMIRGSSARILRFTDHSFCRDSENRQTAAHQHLANGSRVEAKISQHSI